MASIGVVHLVRAGNDIRHLAEFLRSYEENPGGVEHDLIVLFKGFEGRAAEMAACRRELARHPYLEVCLDDRGYDLGAYLKAYRHFEHDCFCFLNSFSVLLDREWLDKLVRQLRTEGVGLVGASGSFQSMFSAFVQKIRRMKPVRKSRSLFAEGNADRLEEAKLLARREMLRAEYDPYPNYHIRTNAFMISREVLNRISYGDLAKKDDVYRFESGKNSLTKQVLRMGLETLVVGKDGRGYRREDWARSRTLWAGEMENLLVADNQTRDYAGGDEKHRSFLYRHAWVDPERWTGLVKRDPRRFCPFCDKKRAWSWYAARDYNRGTTEERFTYSRCLRCGYVYLPAIPENLGRYYPRDYYQFPSSLEEFLPAVEQHEKYKIDLIRKFAKPGKLLEIGPAVGGALFCAKQAGFEVHAIEMDRSCCRFLRDTLGVRVTESQDACEVLRASETLYDVIAAWHVIEHLPNYLNTLKAAADRLAPGGVLVLAAPNPDSLQFRLFRKFWVHLDAPRHVALIPLTLLRLHAVSLGLRTEWTSTTDPGGLGWNIFGWVYSWRNLFKRWLRNDRLALKLAKNLASVSRRLFAGVEIRGDRGTAYTVVFRKGKG